MFTLGLSLTILVTLSLSYYLSLVLSLSYYLDLCLSLTILVSLCLKQRDAACGTTQSPYGCPCATCPLARTQWPPSGASRAWRSREAGAKMAVSWSILTAALQH